MIRRAESSSNYSSFASQRSATGNINLLLPLNNGRGIIWNKDGKQTTKIEMTEASGASETPKPHDTALCKVSMFLAGFVMLTPHRIAITCANHVVKRFHLPLGTVAMFIYRIHNLMELGSFAGTVINTIITLSSTKMQQENNKILKDCVSSISVWLMFVWSVITYVSFITGSDYGYFDGFFWNIVMLAFINGVYSNSTFGIEGGNAPFYSVGLPLFGFVTFLFHKLYKWLYLIFYWDEYDYTLVLYQIWIMMILLLITSIIWTTSRVMEASGGSGGGGGSQCSDGSDTSQESGIAKLFGLSTNEHVNNYNRIHWSPIFMLSLSLGTVYFFYPAISPYQLVDDPFDGKKIELWIQAVSATPHIAFAITQLMGHGPGRTWRKKYNPPTYPSSGCNDGDEETGGDLYALYHLSWLCIIPYITCIYIFFSIMHFPDGSIAKYFRGNVFRTGVVCVLFAWVQEFLEAVGFGGGSGSQVSGKCDDFFNSDAATVNGLLFLVFMTFSMFTEDHSFIPYRCH